MRLPQTHSGRDVLVVGAPPGSGRTRLVRRWLETAGAAWSWVALSGAVPSPMMDVVTRAVGGHLDRDGPGGFLVVEAVEALSPAELEDLIPMAAGLRLVLVGRGDVLPSGLAVRLAGRVARVLGEDLWWPAERVQSQVATLTGAHVDSARADRIHRLTAGWPAGVLALGARPVLPGDADPVAQEGVVDDLVLRGIPGPLLEFVLATSLLPGQVPDPELCAALVPGTNPARLLDEARRWGLTADRWPFTASDILPDNAYHPLVAAAARRMRARRGAGDAENLNRAGVLASARARGPLAVDLFRAAGAWPHVLAELERAAVQGFRGWETPHLHEIIKALPEPVWASDAQGRACVAFAAAICGDHLLAAEVLAPAPPVEWWPAVTGLIGALGGSTNSWDPENAFPLDIFGIRDAGALNATIEVLAARTAAFAGDQGAATRHLASAWETGSDRLPRYVLLAGLGVDALVAAWAGDLSAAGRLAGRAFRLASQAGLDGHPLLATAGLAQAEVLRSRGDAAGALDRLDESAATLSTGAEFVVTPAGGAPPTQAHRVLRARLLLDLGERTAARDVLSALHADGDEQLPPALAVRLALAHARLAELDGDLAAAQSRLEAAPGVPAITSALLFVTLQRQDQHETAAVMARFPADAGPEDRLRRMLSQAAQALAEGRRGPANDLVNEALVAAEPDGHLRVFLDVPAVLRMLISTTLRRAPDASNWRRSLASRLDDAGADDDTVGVTRRELVVLEQLTTDLTHAQIAAGLFVSENTLKSHCRNLYRKLGVHSREEAVRIARVKGWLSSSPRGDAVIDVNITPTPEVIEL
ncbi:LuxR C-terminal-related transcriptional regulator [Kineosporia mesophila]|uniref:LuxR C-terminal-related transcriptional regulator n=1 Tax=Kineosporia mesophila TaxID=566012 RepID=UPI001E30C101|nr:LuxR C-terminal-related transcriptional regulator [Kineosporia mesophila]MCD5350205.1 LuxR C-terminal-related transcriptional regulator [Kineosporia mesophila]